MFCFVECVRNYFFFSEGEVLFCDDVCVGFVFLLLFFFWKEVFVIGISRASVWLFGFGVVYFFSEGEVLFCDVFLLLSFSSFCFFGKECLLLE